MPKLACLNNEEKRAFIHLVKNEVTKKVLPGQEADIKAIQSECDNSFIQSLAKLSEESNHAVKNTYLHHKKTMAYADKKRMPIDERKVKDMLRHQHEFRSKIEDQIPNNEDIKRGK